MAKSSVSEARHMNTKRTRCMQQEGRGATDAEIEFKLESKSECEEFGTGGLSPPAFPT
jgi:hypothetical protein